MPRKRRSRPVSSPVGHPGPAAPPPVEDRTRTVAGLLDMLSVQALLGILIYRPMKSGAVKEYAGDALFGTLLLVAAVCWAGALVLERRRPVRWTVQLGVAAALLLWMAGSIAAATDLFSALTAVGQFAGYVLVLFLVVQHAGRAETRRLIGAVLIAGLALAAAFSLFHYAVYMPAMREWFRADPQYFENMLDAQGRMAADLRNRLIMPRAHGSFLTPNQLAGFLILVGFFTADRAVAVWQARGRRWALVPLGVLVLACASFAMSRSKGAIVAASAGLVFLGSALILRKVGERLGRRGRVALAAGIAAAVVLGGAATLVHLRNSDGWFARSARASLGVRLGYWEATLKMIAAHPLAGVGPGNWADEYSRLKRAEDEETQLPHNDYLQTAAESGLPAAVLYALLLGLGVAACLARRPETARGPETAPGPEPGATADPAPAPDPPLPQGCAAGNIPTQLLFTFVVAVCILSFDYSFVGTFAPPQTGVESSLLRHSWVVYVAAGALWLTTFLAAYAALPGVPAPGPRGAERYLLAAGLFAFMVHSGGEFLRVIGAIGTVAFALFGLAAVCSRRAPRVWRPGQGGRYILFGAGALSAIAACFLAAQPLIELQVDSDVEFSLRPEVAKVETIASPGYAKLRDVVRVLGEAAAAVPIDADVVNLLGDYHFRLARVLYQSGRPEEASAEMSEARSCYERAVALNPARGKFRQSLGFWCLSAGRKQEAVAHLRAAAESSPSRPLGWFLYATTAAAVSGAGPEVCEALRQALALSPRQYHERNRLTPEQESRARQILRSCPEPRGQP